VLAEPDDIAVALDDDRELAIGVADARKELAPWYGRRVDLAGAVEVHGEAWAWAAGELEPFDGDRGDHLRVLVFAMRGAGASGRWNIVAAHAIAVAAMVERR
jgi:hypothetical protein